MLRCILLRMTMPEWSHRTELIDTTPLTIALEFLHEGRWWPGRTSRFARDSRGWHISVMAEQATMRAGVRAGWLDLDEVRPGQHEVRTTHPGRRWGGWEPPFWPEDLAPFTEASSNLRERPKP